jgi:hypothetical protein
MKTGRFFEVLEILEIPGTDGSLTLISFSFHKSWNRIWFEFVSKEQGIQNVKNRSNANWAGRLSEKN